MFESPLDQSQSSPKLAGKLQPGIVANNNDPMQLQRVKVRISTLHGNYSDGDLPWALPVAWASQGFTPGVGSFGVPAVGSKVMVYFPEEDDHHPYYVGDIYDANVKLTDFSADYPYSYGWVDSAGNLFIINTKQNTVNFVHVKGTRITINSDGSAELAVQGTFRIKATTEIALDAPVIKFNSGDASGLAITPRTPPTPMTFSGKMNY